MQTLLMLKENEKKVKWMNEEKKETIIIACPNCNCFIKISAEVIK